MNYNKWKTWNVYCIICEMIQAYKTCKMSQIYEPIKCYYKGTWNHSWKKQLKDNFLLQEKYAIYIY